MPRKKTGRKPLDAPWKTIRHAVSRLPVRVEHAIAGVKHRPVVADPCDFAQGTAIYRNFKAGFEDAVLLSACGLHNFRLSGPTAAYTPQSPNPRHFTETHKL